MSKFLVSIAATFAVVVLMLGVSACGQERAPIAHSVAGTETVVEKPPVSETVACIDASKINASRMCTMDYTPVCGCDGKTHSNICRAQNAGVTSWEKGACSGAVSE